MDIKPFLDYIKQYVELTPGEESILLLKVKVRKYLKGQFVVQNGDICRHESFVLAVLQKLLGY